MLGSYRMNPLFEFYKSLGKEIRRAANNSLWGYDNSIDDCMKPMLENNGCTFADDSKIYTTTTLLMNKTYVLCYIFGAKGNSVNECFDFLEFQGMKYLIIFLDCFIGMNEEPEIKDEIDKEAAEFMGKYEYYNMITKITNAFIYSIAPPAVFTSALSTTAAANVYRYAPDIIAGKIIYYVCGKLTENDISGIDYKTLWRFVQEPTEDLLYGIYVK